MIFPSTTLFLFCLQVQEDLRKREQESGGDLETGLITGKDKKRGEDPPLWAFVSKIFIQAFTMTFLAEWGDRSQLATIVLAAREEITGVVSEIQIQMWNFRRVFFVPKPAMCIFYRFSTTRFERLSMPFPLPSKGDRWRPWPRHVHGPGRPGRAHHRPAHLRPHGHPHRRSRLPALRPHGALHGPQRGMSCSCDEKKLVPPVILSQERNGEYFLPLNVNRYQAWGGEQVCGVDCEEERSEAVLVPFFVGFPGVSRRFLFPMPTRTYPPCSSANCSVYSF